MPGRHLGRHSREEGCNSIAQAFSRRPREGGGPGTAYEIPRFPLPRERRTKPPSGTNSNFLTASSGGLEQATEILDSRLRGNDGTSGVTLISRMLSHPLSMASASGRCAPGTILGNVVT